MNHETPYFYMGNVHVSAHEDAGNGRVFRIHQALGFCHALMTLNGNLFSPVDRSTLGIAPFHEFPLQAVRDHKGTLMCKWGATPPIAGLIFLEEAWASQAEYTLAHFIAPKEKASGLLDRIQYNTEVPPDQEASKILDFWASENLWDNEVQAKTTFRKRSGNVFNLEDFRLPDDFY
jgi:hypothetical protein